MIQKVFILGNHIQALCLARQIKAMKIEVNLFTDTRYSISRFSNAVDKTYFFRDMPELMEKIERFGKKEKQILLFPTNDQMVDFLAQNYAALDKKFYLGIPVPETVAVFYDKRNTYRFAAEHGIPIPDTWIPENMEDLNSMSRDLPYPVVLKPAVMHTFHKALGKKAFKCNSRQELLKKAEEINTCVPIHQMIVQEYLAGGAKALYSFGVFAVNGKPVASLMANRIRQNPMDFGNSTTYARTCNIAAIKQTSEKILKKTEYFGLAEIEFMYDFRTKQYKFLEINPRSWKWHSISDGMNFSFIGKMIDCFNTGNIDQIHDYDKEIAWVERLTDLAVVAKEILKRRMTFSEAFETYQMEKVYPVWSEKDVMPFFMYLILAPYLYFKRH
jgi:predicted ATP-grasp superfamily ATP-dependent carboligase